MTEINQVPFSEISLTEELASLTRDDVAKFFMDKVKIHNCPCCAENSWQIFSGPDVTYGLAGINQKGEINNHPFIIPAVGALCNNCGFIRPHNAFSVLNWKKNKGGRK